VFTELRARDGITILYTSHTMAEVEEVCDRVIFIHEGRVLAEGSPLAVTRQVLGSGVEEAQLEEVFIKVAREGAAAAVGVHAERED
jgi:ABC-2 type transport system ATP-binding protein